MAGVRGSRKRRRYDQNVSTTAASGSTMKEEPQDESSRRKNVVVSPRPRSGEPICSIGYSFGLHYKIVSDITWQFVESMEQKGFEHLKRPSTEIDMKGIEKLNGIPNSNRVIDATHFNLCLTSTKPSFYVWLDHNKHSMVMNAIVDPESVYKIGESGYSPLPCPVVPYEQKVREDILMEQSSIGFFKEKTNIEYPGTHVRVSTKGSCAPAPKPADDDIDFTNLCKLYVEDPNLRSVAYEKMHEYSTTIHHKPIVSRRQIGGSECGYYVMGHMFNIVSEGITNEWSTTFCNSEPFSKIEIEDIRIRWAKVLLEIAHSQGVC
ncbi:hypothetical protein RIF29_27757 [Crotalaria pallida]|uniref:Uncharacterized protein n=1 Tax=Crotalaria pallida TaxID=3830 RepID=A0AAN9I2N2_CROPI